MIRRSSRKEKAKITHTYSAGTLWLKVKQELKIIVIKANGATALTAGRGAVLTRTQHRSSSSQQVREVGSTVTSPTSAAGASSPREWPDPPQILQPGFQPGRPASAPRSRPSCPGSQGHLTAAPPGSGGRPAPWRRSENGSWPKAASGELLSLEEDG